jgi:hypothetical protein
MYRTADNIFNIELFLTIPCTYKLFNGFHEIAYCNIPNNFLFFIIGLQNQCLIECIEKNPPKFTVAVKAFLKLITTEYTENGSGRFLAYIPS